MIIIIIIMEINKILCIHLEFKDFKKDIYHYITTLSIQPVIYIET